MKYRRTIIWLRLISLMAVINVVVFGSLPATASLPGRRAVAPAPAIPVTSREYKLLLKPEIFPGAVFKDGRFSDGPGGLKEFWQKLRQDVKTIKDRDFSTPTKVRKVEFYDTKSADLCARHFIMRLRTQTKKEGSLKFDLTYKFRPSERFVATAIGLNVVKGGLGEVEFGEERVLGPNGNGVESRFSFDNKLKDHNVPAMKTWGQFATLFPGLSSLGDMIGVGMGEELQLVNDAPVTELEFETTLANLGLGGAGKSVLSLWYEGGNMPKLLVAEFSYQLEFTSGTLPADASNNAEQLFKDVLRVVNNALLTGTSKTALVYKGKCSQARGLD